MRTFPIYKEPTIEVIEDLEVLRTIKHDFAWDIETNSIKGHSKESKIMLHWVYAHSFCKNSQKEAD
jgi:hypothetical protein